MMLRCINPNEAKLLDAAAGIHVRFRLAGVRISILAVQMLLSAKKTRLWRSFLGHFACAAKTLS